MLIDRLKTQQTSRQQENDRGTDSQPTDSPNSTTDLPLDVMFDILSNQRRRWILQYLRVESEETTLGELAECIASIENDKPVAALSSEDRKRVYVALYQAHLPKMDDANVINFDQNRKTVTPGPAIEYLVPYLPQTEGSPGSSTRWTRYFLVVAVVGIGVFVVQTVLSPGVWVFGFLLGIALVTVGVIALTYLRRGDRLP